MPEPVAPTTSTRAPLGHHNLFQSLRQPERGEVRNLVGNGTDHHTDVLLLHEDIHAKARHAGQRDGKVALQIAREVLALPLVHQRICQIPGHLAGQLLVGHRLQGTLHLHRRRKILGHEQIRATRLAHRRQQLGDVAPGLLLGKARHCNPLLIRPGGMLAECRLFATVLLLTGHARECTKMAHSLILSKAADGIPNPGYSVSCRSPVR